MDDETVPWGQTMNEMAAVGALEPTPGDVVDPDMFPGCGFAYGDEINDAAFEKMNAFAEQHGWRCRFKPINPYWTWPLIYYPHLTECATSVGEACTCKDWSDS